MRSRAFNKRIDIYQITAVPDGFGGNTTTDALIASTWASVTTLNPNSNLDVQFGVMDASNSINVTIRQRNDLSINIQTMFVIYRGDKYIIKSNPINVNFEDGFIKFICTKQN